jgi:hypothetical protein
MGLTVVGNIQRTRNDEEAEEGDDNEADLLHNGVSGLDGGYAYEIWRLAALSCFDTTGRC